MYVCTHTHTHSHIMQVAEGTACALLHHNYLQYFSDIDDVCEATSWLSDSDLVYAKWDSGQTLRGYAGSIAARGLLFANKHPVQNKFTPLHR